MKTATKRRHADRRLSARLDRLERRQDRLTHEVLNAVVHLLNEYLPTAEPVPGPRPKRK